MGIHPRLRGFLMWFRPSFQWRYPLNQIAVFAVFLFTYSISSIAAAADKYWLYPAGTDLSVACENDKPADATGCNSDNLFIGGEQVAAYKAYQFPGYAINYLFIIPPESFDCASSDVAGGAELCGSSCPAQGETRRIATPINGKMVNGQFVEEFPEGGLTITIGGSVSADGCGFASIIPDGSGSGGTTDPDTKVKCAPTGECFRFETYVSTGQSLEPAEGQAVSTVIDSPGIPDEQTETATDTRQATSSTTRTDPITNTVGGETVTTQTITNTETRGDGSVVQTQDDVTTVTQTDGITKTETQTTATTTHADGSQTVNTTTNISYTQHPQTVFNIDNSSDRISISNVPGSSTGSQSTTTTQFDSSGNQTSQSTTEGPATGDQDLADQQEAEENDQPSIGSGPEFGGKDSWWESSYPNGIDGVLDDAKTDLQSNGLISGFFSPSGLPTSGSFPTFSMPSFTMGSFNFSGGEIAIPDIVVSFLRTAFMILSLLSARRLVLGG